MTTLSKADQALNTYNSMVEAGKEGKELKAACVASYVTDLEMSEKGASTYFYNAKKRATGGTVKSYYKGKDSQDPSSDTACERQIYSIVNEKDGLVDNTESGYNLAELRKKSKGRLVVKGLPDLESPVNRLKAAKA